MKLLRIFFIYLILSTAVSSHAQQGVLEEYIDSPDSSFSYQLVNTEYNIFYITYILEMTSQKWHPDDVSPEKWEHWVVIVEPWLFGQFTEDRPMFSLVHTDTAILNIIRGDADHEDEPSGAKEQTIALALQNSSIAAEIHAIPIGPVVFLDEEKDTDWWDDLNPFKDDDYDKILRQEDSFQARSLDLALDTGDFTWASVSPMVKGVIRAMDTIQDFLEQKRFFNSEVKEFVLVGHSKRGWTAWLTGLLDNRVVGIATLGYDLLNIVEQFKLQDSHWDEQSEEFKYYEDFNIPQRLQTETGQQLLLNIDPYAYLDRLDIPVLILVGTSDNYSVVDSINLYFNNLNEDSRIFYDPNMGHDIRNSPGTQDVTAAFYHHIVHNKPLPEFTWNDLTDGNFEVTPVSEKPVAVKLWTATNPQARDFRETTDIAWSSNPVSANSRGSYSGTAAYPPEGGYTAFYIELTYQSSTGNPSYSLTTPMTVLGD